MTRSPKRARRKREMGWAVIDRGGTYQSKWCGTRKDAEYDQAQTEHIMDGYFVIRRAMLVTWTLPKPAKRKGRRK